MGKRRRRPKKHARGLLAVFANPILYTLGALPLGAALGLTIVDRPIYWWPAMLFAPLIVAAAYAHGIAYVKYLDKPDEVWSADLNMTIALDGATIVTGILGMTYVVGPWTPAYDNTGFLGLAIGFAIAFGVAGIMFTIIWMLTDREKLGWSTPILFIFVLGGGAIVGLMFGVPFYLLWTFEVFAMKPGFMSREGFAVLVTAVLTFLLLALNAGFLLSKHSGSDDTDTKSDSD